MQVLPVFIVHCERIPRRAHYYLRFQANDQLSQRIKELPEDTRKWSGLNLAWEVSTYSLFLLIKRYTKSTKIHFDFGNDDSRKVFIEQIKKIEIAEEEKRLFIADLDIKKEQWVEYKKQLETEYVKYSDKMHALLNEDIKLYPHQIVAALFMNATRNTLISHEMGLGKTLSSILYVEMNKFDKVVVVTPNSLKFNYFYEVEKFTESNAHIIKWGKNKCSIEDAKYIIVNYDFFNPSSKEAFKTKWDKLNIGKIDAVICDECFPYDTKISTDVGELKIGDIVSEKLDVKILSYNHKLKKIVSKPILRYLYNGCKETIKVRFSNGTIIECTPDHKFYSIDDDKYKSIDSFKIGEKVYEYKIKKSEDINRSESMSTMQTELQTKTKFTNLLFKKMFSKIYFRRECSKGIDNQKTKRKFIPYNIENMSDLPTKIPFKRTSLSKILLNKLFSKMENESTRNKKMCIYERECGENFGEIIKKLLRKTRVKNSIIQTNETKQSNVQSRNVNENEKKIYWKDIFIKRWEWAINKTTNNLISSNFRSNQDGNGICNTNIETTKENGCSGKISTDTLQSGYWNTRNKISNRDRRKFTQNKKMEILRQKENGNIGIVWVENIEILESGDRPEFRRSSNENKRVYDLEIEDNHNFFANGILVSNCQKLKNIKANTYKNFSKTFKKEVFKNGKISKIFLSGTPAPNRAHELYSVLNQISPTDFATKKYFNEYYCGMVYDYEYGWSYDPNNMETRFEELYHKIAPFTHRKKKSEVLKDLPDKIYQKVMFEMDDSEYKVYDQIESGVANEFVEHPNGNALTTMIRLRQYTSHLKIKPLVELVESILETGEKVVIVDYFKEGLIELKKLFGDIAALHTGDQSPELRADIIKEFQDPNGSIKVFLGSIQTCNYGLTLTAASKLFIMTLPYSVGEYDQVADRLHRIGQKDVVNIYPMMFRESIDEYVYAAIEGKRKEIMKVIDNEDYESKVGESILSDVIRKIKEKHGK